MIDLRRSRALLFFLLMLWAAGCHSFPTIPTTFVSPPTPQPTARLETASDFIPGECLKPADQYLFTRYTSQVSCTAACNCPVVEAPRPALTRSDTEMIYQPDQVVGMFAPDAPEDPAVGLIDYGQYEETLYVIETLPFEIPRAEISLISCTSEGMIVIEISDSAYFLNPGQTWFAQNVQANGGDCYQTYTVAFTNSGFIPRTQFRSVLSTRDEYIQLEIARYYFSAGEEIKFSVRVIGDLEIAASEICNPVFEAQAGNRWEVVGACREMPETTPGSSTLQPGKVIHFQLPSPTSDPGQAYQYELSARTYRLKYSYTYPGGMQTLVSSQFQVLSY